MTMVLQGIILDKSGFIIAFLQKIPATGTDIPLGPKISNLI